MKAFYIVLCLIEMNLSNAMESHFLDLPKEIKKDIFSLLDTTSLGCIINTSKETKEICDNLFQDRDYLVRNMSGEFLKKFGNDQEKNHKIKEAIDLICRTPSNQLTPQQNYIIGLCYSNQIVLQGNCQKAIEYFDKAAQKDYLPAIDVAIAYYKNGYNGVQINAEKVKQLTQQANNLRQNNQPIKSNFLYRCINRFLYQTTQ